MTNVAELVDAAIPKHGPRGPYKIGSTHIAKARRCYLGQLDAPELGDPFPQLGDYFSSPALEERVRFRGRNVANIGSAWAHAPAVAMINTSNSLMGTTPASGRKMSHYSP